MNELVEGIKREARGLEEIPIMEVCGTHADTIHRHGIPSVVPETIRFVSGPGCPVCVTPMGYIDAAIELARRGVCIATFGDMVRVPGSKSTLEKEKADGADIRIIYSPKDALDIAEEGEVVLLGVGFETTSAPVSAVLKEAKQRKLRNFKLFSAHKLIPPALKMLFVNGSSRMRGLICPGHVSVVIGARAYEEVAREAWMPCVIAGFEPEDILEAVLMILRQIRQGRSEVEIQYKRWVSPEGNAIARRMIEEVFEECESTWRGLGRVGGSGLRLRDAYRAYDAEEAFGLEVPEVSDPPGCECARVIIGQVEPPQCPLFGKKCTPSSPIGACMVSWEGSCAIRYRYGR